MLESTEQSGFSFLDELGGVVISSLPSVIDNVTQKEQSKQTVYVADQTPVKGDAYLSDNLESDFLKNNWQKLAVGGVVLLGVVAFIAKK